MKILILVFLVILCVGVSQESDAKELPVQFKSRVINVKIIPQGDRKLPRLRRWAIEVEVPKEMINKIHPATRAIIEVSSPTRFLRSAGPHEGKAISVECADLRSVMTDLECRATLIRN
jgi:hypothetical protein